MPPTGRKSTGQTLDLFAHRATPAQKKSDPQNPAPQSADKGAARDKAPAGPQVWTVTQVNNKARMLLEKTFPSISVSGEMANFKRVGGHCYFSLRDKNAQLPAVLFRREAQRLKFRLEPGMEVVATGRLTVYGPYGRYQLMVERMEPRGAGALQVAFEQLKAKLQQEGLFEPAKKRALPFVPSRVAVITSPTGAVIRDISNVARRRFPRAKLLVIPTRVQGAESAPQIARALQRAAKVQADMGFDVAIVARGGGSLEDLWGFNDERVARAIAEFPVPVVSAVGHETDFTIADFVADVRAPTPSAAAELVFPRHSELEARLRGCVDRSAVALRRRVESYHHRVRAARASLGDARTVVRHYAQRLALAQGRCEDHLRRCIAARRTRLHGIEKRLQSHHPKVKLGALRGQVGAAERRIAIAMRQRLEAERKELARLGQRLDALSPLGVLGRGYAIALTEDGRAVRAQTDVAPGDRLTVRLAEGQISTRVEKG